jgi:DNA-binding transcriptional ArsR family regulator
MMARCAKRSERGSGLLELLCREPRGQAGVQHRNNSSYRHFGDGGRNAGAGMDIKVMQTNACAAAAFLKSLANDSRLMILCELLKGERCVAELEEIVSLSQSALSQHLARLRRNHLVKTRRESQTIYYSIADPGVKKIIGALYDLYCGPSKGPEVKKKRK